MKKEIKPKEMSQKIIGGLTGVKDWSELTRVLLAGLDRVKELGKIPSGRNWLAESQVFKK